ncbi:MAG: FkbM family methyltransferase [Gemmatimonadaceae bacterium]|nr:FkbM family methyltransferase [Gemmatimonadaceae bacterium]
MSRRRNASSGPAAASGVAGAGRGSAPGGELEALLARDPAQLRTEARGAFAAASRGRPIVLMGAGGLGRRTLAGLRAAGVEPLAFADNSSELQGSLIEGVRVRSPADAAREYAGRAAFVVTIWGAGSPHRLEHSRAQLTALGCDVIVPFPLLYWAYPAELLPHYLQDEPHKVLEQARDVRRAFDLWEDETSRAEYVAQVRLRMNADFDGLPRPVGHLQYFPSDLFEWSSAEWIVDGGAYDGDSIRDLVRLHGEQFARVLAIEPDPANFQRLEATVAGLPAALRSKIACECVALASETGVLHLDATGTASSATGRMPASDGVAVRAEALDTLLAGKVPTMIKLDIEGAEPDALTGARRTIVAHAPIVAACVYHRQDHLWQIPLMLREWQPDYTFFLRPHNEEGWDLVCYAVPRARLVRRPQ